MKTELVSHLGPAFSKISDLEVRPNQLPAKNIEICNALKAELSKQWLDLRGIEIVSIAFNSVTIPQEDEDMIKQVQRNAVMQNPTMAAATLVGAQADAMKAAAENENGAMMGFMGLGMAQQAGNVNPQNLFQMGMAQQAQNQQAQNQQAQQSNPQKINNNTWKCSCGVDNVGKFCTECGKPKPAEEWTCSCGAVNKGKFCAECGKPKPAGEWTCSCGAVNSGKFCAECGNQRI